MRDRVLVLNLNNAGYFKSRVSPPSFVTLGHEVVKSRLLVGDYGHYGWPNFPPMKDVGGPFQVQTTKMVLQPVNVGTIYWPGAPNGDTYTGYIVQDMIQDGFVSPNDIVSAWGAKAYNRMRPDAPSMQAAVAVYELKDVPGMLEQRFLDHGLAGIGDYYLALKFGWEALLSDVRSFVLTQMSAQKRLAQLLRDEGRPVRRKVKLMSDKQVISENFIGHPVSGCQPTFVSGYYGLTTTKSSRYVYTDLWASAQFRYWLPSGPRDIAWKRRMLASIFGLNPNPATVYKAIPWSWLVDWFSSLGDCISNYWDTVAQRCAADYYYLMERSGVYTELNVTNEFHDYETGGIKTVNGTGICDTYGEFRIKGDPFGLNTAPNSLGSVQLAILGALGLSRLR